MTLARFTLVTANPGKLAEARRLWHGDFETAAIDLPEIQSLDLEEILRGKAAEAWRRLARPVVVEETSLELAALDGFPGPLVKWMLQAVGAEGLARTALALGNPRATARCMLMWSDGNRVVIAEGSTTGTLLLPPRGDHGFGWDPVFSPDGGQLTFAELPPERKDELGHRGRAWRALKLALQTVPEV